MKPALVVCVQAAGADGTFEVGLAVVGLVVRSGAWGPPTNSAKSSPRA
jgi:hypothetical protein